MPEMRYLEALRDALRLEMERDPDVYIIGEDVGTYGNVFGVTKGLMEQFGSDRVRDTPITESAIVGAAVGSAACGLRPVDTQKTALSSSWMAASMNSFSCASKGSSID